MVRTEAPAEAPAEEQQEVPTEQAPPQQAQPTIQQAPAYDRPQYSRPQYTESRTDLTDPAQRAAAARDTREQQPRQPMVADKLPGRNDPCPCGSGQKFKNCHGRGL